MLFGKHVVLKPVLFDLNGDISGLNEVCSHYNSNGNISRPFRDCFCQFEDMSKSNPSCVYITQKMIKKAEKDPQINKKGDLKSLSYYQVSNFWNMLHLADPKAGIIIHFPPGGLHTFGDGIYKYEFKVIHDLVGPKKQT